MTDNQERYRSMELDKQRGLSNSLREELTATLDILLSCINEEISIIDAKKWLMDNHPHFNNKIQERHKAQNFGLRVGDIVRGEGVVINEESVTWSNIIVVNPQLFTGDRVKFQDIEDESEPLTGSVLAIHKENNADYAWIRLEKHEKIVTVDTRDLKRIPIE